MCQNPHKLGEKKCWEKERRAELKLLALTSLFCCGSLRNDVVFCSRTVKKSDGEGC